MNARLPNTDPAPARTFPRRLVPSPQTAVAVLLCAACILWVAWTNGFSTAATATLIQLLTTAAIYAIAGVGLNLQFGHGGLLNFGYVAFMAVGAYTAVLLVGHQAGEVSVPSNGAMPLVAAIPAGMASAAALGLIFGIPTVRVRSHYLAIVMIALAEILRLIIRNTEGLTGGVFGVLLYSDAIQGHRPGFIEPLANDLGSTPDQVWLLILCWALLIVLTLATAALIRTPWGRLVRAVRDDEYAAKALGKSANLIKVQTLMIGGAIGGLAGALLAFAVGQLDPDLFLAQITFFVFAIVILGGTGSAWGPMVGAVIFWSIITQTDAFASSHLGGGTAGSAARFILVGVLLVLLIAFRPQGILGKPEEAVLELG